MPYYESMFGGGTNKCEKIADTNGNTSEQYSVDISQYDFIILTLGSSTAAYGAITIPTSIKDLKYAFNCYAYNVSGQIVARGDVNFSTKTITTSAAAYNAMLFGIKKINSI